MWLVFRHQPLFYLHPFLVQTRVFCSTLSNKRMHHPCGWLPIAIGTPPTTLLFTPVFGSNSRFLFHFIQQANASPVWLVTDRYRYATNHSFIYTRVWFKLAFSVPFYPTSECIEKPLSHHEPLKYSPRFEAPPCSKPLYHLVPPKPEFLNFY